MYIKFDIVLLCYNAHMAKEKKTVRIVFETSPEIRKNLRVIMAMRDLPSMKDALEQLIQDAPEVKEAATRAAARLPHSSSSEPGQPARVQESRASGAAQTRLRCARETSEPYSAGTDSAWRASTPPATAPEPEV